MALLAARDLSKTHALSPLFEKLSITFQPGERVGLIGPNGGGKTALLRILAGAEQPDSGKVEEYEQTVRARKMLRRLGFEDGDQPVDTLSGGWRKRLAIGCALVQEPDLLLLDEPTNHLDLAGIEWLERFLARSRLSFILPRQGLFRGPRPDAFSALPLLR